MSRKTIIYLANPCNTRFGCSPSTVPLEIGYIKAYAMSQLPGEVDIKLYRTFESLYEAIQAKEPDIVGCSWYGWNRCLTVNALAYIKSRYPAITTVVGGANVPEKAEGCLEDFKEFPCVDIMIPNEGEVPFVNLLKIFIKGGRDAVFKTAIDGIFYMSNSRKLVSGKPLKLTEDVNIFPSPYLKGYLDEFLDSGLMPIVQTARGCPFYCLFCVSARDSWNKVRPFDTERVKAEIDYLEAHAKNRTVRFTDENFGIIPRDLEITRYIEEKRTRTGYPGALRVYTYGDFNDRIRKITLLLKDLIPMNISTQTLTGPVLKNIRRKNIDMGKFRDAVNWAHKNDINVTTEMIFGLPGETYESFMDVINKFVDLRLDSVAIGTLSMLKETEISRPESISKYGYKILYSVSEGGYTKFDQFENVEINAMAVESKAFSFEEYTKIKLFIMVYDIFMFLGYFKEMVYIWENRNVKIIDVISEFLDNPARYPLFSRQLERFKKCIQANLFKTKEDVHTFFSRLFPEGNTEGQHIGLKDPFILPKIISGEMIHTSNQEKMIDETIEAAVVVFKRNGRGAQSEFLKEMQFAKLLVQSVIIPFWEKPAETITLSSPYDLIAWRNHDFRGTLSDFNLPGSAKYRFKIRAVDQYDNFIRENSNKPLYLQSECFFRAFRSNNIRRFMAVDDGVNI